MIKVISRNEDLLDQDIRKQEVIEQWWVEEKTTEWMVAALTCHLSVIKEGREEERKGGVTVWFS